MAMLMRNCDDGALTTWNSRLRRDEQVHDLAGHGRAIVDDREVGDGRQIGGRQALEKRQHRADASQIRRIDLENGVARRRRMPRPRRARPCRPALS